VTWYEEKYFTILFHERFRISGYFVKKSMSSLDSNGYFSIPE
jgi:hypothetical protein